MCVCLRAECLKSILEKLVVKVSGNPCFEGKCWRHWSVRHHAGMFVNTLPMQKDFEALGHSAFRQSIRPHILLPISQNHLPSSGKCFPNMAMWDVMYQSGSPLCAKDQIQRASFFQNNLTLWQNSRVLFTPWVTGRDSFPYKDSHLQNAVVCPQELSEMSSVTILLYLISM